MQGDQAICYRGSCGRSYSKHTRQLAHGGRSLVDDVEGVRLPAREQITVGLHRASTGRLQEGLNGLSKVQQLSKQALRSSLRALVVHLHPPGAEHPSSRNWSERIGSNRPSAAIVAGPPLLAPHSLRPRRLNDTLSCEIEARWEWRPAMRRSEMPSFGAATTGRFGCQRTDADPATAQSGFATTETDRGATALAAVQRLSVGGTNVLAIGVVLLVIAFAFAIPPLWTVGLAIAWIGLALWVLSTLGHKVGGHAIWP
jgi:hypothetical protein